MRLILHAPTELEIVEVSASHLHVEGDAGGEGFGPLQMFAASLALCTASVLAGYAQNVVKVGVDGLRLRVRWDYAEDPYRVAGIELDVTWPELPDNRLEPARRAAAACTVHRTLEQPPHLKTTVRRA